MEKILLINPDGELISLWDDMLSDIEGDKQIQRASNVEFDMDSQGWIVTIEIGEYKGCCLPRLFKKRNEAIAEEIRFFNQEFSEGRI